MLITLSHQYYDILNSISIHILQYAFNRPWGIFYIRGTVNATGTMASNQDKTCFKTKLTDQCIFLMITVYINQSDRNRPMQVVQHFSKMPVFILTTIRFFLSDGYNLPIFSISHLLVVT